MVANFEKMDFKRKVDVLVAIHVVGIDPEQLRIEYHDYHWMGQSSAYWAVYQLITTESGIIVHNSIPCFSTLLTTAWDLVRHFKFFYLYRADFINDGKWECKLHDAQGEVKIDETDGRKYYGVAETEMLAICYAGLKAVGYDVESFLEKEGKSGIRA